MSTACTLAVSRMESPSYSEVADCRNAFVKQQLHLSMTHTNLSIVGCLPAHKALNKMQTNTCTHSSAYIPAVLRMLLSDDMAERASPRTTKPSASNLKVILSGLTPDWIMRERVMAKLQAQGETRRVLFVSISTSQSQYWSCHMVQLQAEAEVQERITPFPAKKRGSKKAKGQRLTSETPDLPPPLSFPPFSPFVFAAFPYLIRSPRHQRGGSNVL